jgi:Virulence factor membrane-bound polymerase, C-terminal/O-Antigen ligase
MKNLSVTAQQEKHFSTQMLMLVATPVIAFCLPFDTEPSRLVEPWLYGIFCVALLLAVIPTSRLPRQLNFGLVAIAASLIGHGIWIQPLYARESLVSALGLGMLWFAMRIGASIGKDKRLTAALACGWLMAALISCVLGILQTYMPPLHWLEIVIKPLIQSSMHANLTQYNLFAALIAIGLLSLAYLCEVSKDWRLANRNRYLAAACILLLFATVAGISRSRIGLVFWLIIWLGAIFYGMRLERLTKTVLLASFPMVLLVGQLVAKTVDICSGDSTELCLLMQPPSIAGLEKTMAINLLGEHTGSGRTLSTQDFFSIFLQHPWTGTGWGSAATVHFENAGNNKFNQQVYLDNTHNIFTHLMLELGTPTAMFIILILLYGVIRAKPWKVYSSEQGFTWSILAILGVYSQTEFPYFHGPFIFTIGLCLGIASAASSSQIGTFIQPTVTKAQILVAAILAIFSISCLRYYQQVVHRGNNPNNHVMTWLFHRHIEMIDLSQTPTNMGNAAERLERNLRSLEHVPLYQTVERVIEAAKLTGANNVANNYIKLYSQYYKQRYLAWQSHQDSHASIAKK